MMSISNMASAYTAEMSCFFDGIRLDTGETTHDPTILVMIFGKPDVIERVLMPEGDLSQFHATPAIGLSAIFQPAWDASLWLITERTLRIAVVNDTNPFALDQLVFESFDAGHQIAIRSREYLVAQTGVGAFFKVTATYLDDLDVRFVVDIVPEPSSILFVGSGIVLLLGWLHHQRRKKRILSGLLTLLFLIIGVICHPLFVNAQDASIVTISKEGTGDGTVAAGDVRCDLGCLDVRVPYTENTAAIVKAIPSVNTAFIGWRNANGLVAGKVYFQPGETLKAIFRYVMSPAGGIATQIGSAASTTFPSDAIPKQAQIDITTLTERSIPPTDEGYWRLSNAYAFHAFQTNGEEIAAFEKEIEITLPYAPDSLNGLDPQQFAIHYYDQTAGRWEALPSEHNLQSHTMTVKTNRFGQFAIFCPILEVVVSEFTYDYWFERFNIPSHALQPLSIEQVWSQDGELTPFTTDTSIYGVAMQADIHLRSAASLVRVIVTDTQGKEYLLFEAYPLITENTLFTVSKTSEETWEVAGIVPETLYIQAVDASIHIRRLFLDHAPKMFENRSSEETRTQVHTAQIDAKIATMNRLLPRRGLKWSAGATSVSHFWYEQKNGLFGGAHLPNLQGFDYYAGGIFELRPENTASDLTMNSLDRKESDNRSVVNAFDWRNRHGRNWITPVRAQLGCGSCWAFGVTGAVEAMTNLYFNQLLNLNLSEQQLLSCGKGDCNGGKPKDALEYYKTHEVVDDDCFPYQARNSRHDCPGKICRTPQERIRINDYAQILPLDTASLKRTLITEGPIVTEFVNWEHVMLLVGYENDDYIFKNSYGENTGVRGYVYLKESFFPDIRFKFFLAKAPITSAVVSRQVSCVDQDRDGYCQWGISHNKPETCPSSCQAQQDCDDSNPHAGRFNTDFSCARIEPPTPTPLPITPTPTPKPTATPTPLPNATPTPSPHTTCSTDDAEAGWYFVYSVRSVGSCGGVIGTPWIGGDKAMVEVEFTNGIKPNSFQCAPANARLSVVPENGHWYYTCTLEPAGSEEVWARWKW